jgi:prolipoprotein diacylglyceryl transferase
MILASIPSPTQGVWDLGPLPIRAYALCIVAGIVAAVVLTEKRWLARGGAPGDVLDIAVWAVPFGIVGGRIYHVISSPRAYFGAGGHPLRAFAIWEGGLGIWGAIALGGVGAWIACRRRGIPLPAFADALAPGLLVAQAIGRLGNWFNNELYGGATSLPWKLQIHCLNIDVGHATPCDSVAGHTTVLGYFQPTFLYELLWDAAVGVALLLLDRRLRLGRGNVMALYVMGYTIGRAWIEALRTDHANHVLGLRLNDWTSLVVFVGGLVWFLRHGGFRAEREATPYLDDGGAEDGTEGEHLPDEEAKEVPAE